MSHNADYDAMLSYNWKYQEIALDVYNGLTAEGLRVWMDIKKGIQSGNIHDAMAKGIDNSNAILSFVSETYERSANCKQEFSYAQMKKKLQLPILVQKGYRGNNWLGFCIAGQKYYSMVDPGERAAKIRELAQDLKQGLRERGHGLLSSSGQPESNTSNGPIRYESRDFDFSAAEVNCGTHKFYLPSRYDIETAKVAPEFYDKKISGNKRLVIRAHDTLTKKLVLIKKIDISEDTSKSSLKHAWREMMLGFTLDNPNVAKIKDCWMINRKNLDGDQEPETFFFVTDDYGRSLHQLGARELKREREGHGLSKVSFQLWRKVALEMVKTLVYLKSEGVIHRDIKLRNVVLSDYQDPESTKVTLIDFAGARNVAGGNLTKGIDSAGKAAPEVMLNNTDDLPRVCQKRIVDPYTGRVEYVNEAGYSYPVDVFSAGYLLLEMIQAQFASTFRKFVFSKNYVTGNDRIDDIAPLTFFMEHFSEMNYTDEEIGQMLKPDQNCEMPWRRTPQKGMEFLKRLKKYTDHQKYAYPNCHQHSPSKRFLRGFWFRHLDWSDHQKDQAYDLIENMINYFPHKRAPAETLLQHPLFSDCDKKVNLRPRGWGSENRVDLSSPKKMEVFKSLLLANEMKHSFETNIIVEYKKQMDLDDKHCIASFSQYDINEVVQDEHGGFLPKQMVDSSVQEVLDQVIQQAEQASQPSNQLLFEKLSLGPETKKQKHKAKGLAGKFIKAWDGMKKNLGSIFAKGDKGVKINLVAPEKRQNGEKAVMEKVVNYYASTVAV